MHKKVKNIVSSDLPHLYEAEKGEILYHYTTAEAALSIVKNQVFWLSEYSMTNDSSEYIYAKEKYIEAYHNGEVWIDDLLRLTATTRLVGLEFNTTMMIGCFTANYDDLNQWRSYSDNGKGCVIGFDALFLQDRVGITMRKVNYDPDALTRFVNVGLLMLQEQYEEEPDDLDEIQELASFFISDLYAFKHPGFVSESEIRISRLLAVDKNSKFGLKDCGGHDVSGKVLESLPVKIRKSSFGSTRYIELPITSSDNIGVIRSVGFGPNCSDVVKLKFEKLNKTFSCPIDLWKSKIPYRS